MIEQLIIVKRIFSIADQYSQKMEPLSAGLAISLFQDAVEQLSWCVAKHLDLTVKDNEGFTSLLDKIENHSEGKIPYKAKILELNKARVSFKHYGNLPARSESEKFRAYTYDFLVLSSQRYLDIDFENISLASLISDNRIRKHVEAAQTALLNDSVKDAVEEATLGRFFLFKELERHFPKIDGNLSKADKILERIPGLQGQEIQIFSYLESYLDSVAKFNANALAGGNISEHLYFERILPHVTQFQAGNTKVNWSNRSNPTKEFAEKVIKYVIETAIRVENTGQ
ncbi:hypothetical protein [Alcaligenes phenolicus]|uniref:hypothetical protein n=1 Tax=Alcaligenes TaxID=507 RepID=UPI002AA2B943|nr:hypothetical protein [Alcaligenes phenolicus]MDK7585094.1 hypothetical protein [Alcaligenes phenolicus]